MYVLVSIVYTEQVVSSIVFLFIVLHLLNPLYISHFLYITDLEMSGGKTLPHRGSRVSGGARQAHRQSQRREQRGGGQQLPAGSCAQHIRCLVENSQ